MPDVLVVARVLLAVVFGVAGAAKLVNPRVTRTRVRDFGVAGPWITAVTVAVPVAELVVAAGLLWPPTVRWAALAALALLTGFTTLMAVNLRRGRRPACGCFGARDTTPVSTTTLVRNGFLATSALLVALGTPVAVVPALAGAAMAPPRRSPRAVRIVTGPDCPSCAPLLAEIGRWYQSGHHRGRITVVGVGDVRQPTATLVRHDGRTHGNTAVGPDAIRRLLLERRTS